MQTYQLAQFNIGRLKYPRHSTELADYEATLDSVLPIAVDWPGFIWIHDDDIIELTEQHFGHQVAANISVWADIESLQSFMQCTPHDNAMQRRAEWFDEMDRASFALWWVVEGHRPSFAEACERLSLLESEGPGPDAFDLEHRFDPP